MIHSVKYKPGQWEAIFQREPPVEVHSSDIRMFKECRMRWAFSSMLRLGLEPSVPNRHLWLGRAVHHALGAYYGGKGPQGLTEAYEAHVSREMDRLGTLELSDENWVDINSAADLGRDMLEHYRVWAPKRDKQDGLRITMPEVPFSAPVPGLHNVVLAGTPDGHARMQGGFWLLEWKTCATFPNFNGLLLDEQAKAYNWGAHNDPRFEGMKPKGTVFTFLRKKAPARPRVLKTGGLSRNKRIDTTADVYLSSLLQYGYDPEHYRDILMHLRDKEDNFFQRVWITYDERALCVFERNLTAVVKQMVDPDTPIYPSPNWYRCPWCPFRAPCTLALHGVSPKPLLNADFRERTFGLLEEEETG